MPAEFALAFVAVMTAILAGTWLNAKSLKVRRLEAGETADKRMSALSDENGALREKVAYLEDRVTVLERIVTDDGHRLSQEIEALRLTRS
jgi:uncharacterized protein YlxW (UPF0749 family)